MAIGDIHIAGPGGWPLCGESGPLMGYNATSPSCRDCERIEWDQRSSAATAAESKVGPSPRTFRVINGDNGWGLSRDRDIVSDAFFSAGWRRLDRGKVVANVHLERIDPGAIPSAKHNIVIPNPEWWCPVGNIGVVDLNNALKDPSVVVWAKTRDAERIFISFGARVEYVGFRSNDRRYPLIQREKSFLHIAGEGPNKRTGRLLSMWHPDWPDLTITCNNHSITHRSNVKVIHGRIDDSELRILQNRHAFHVYPSRYEGFGHAQWEGLSCGAMVFVCDGPPFDEHGTVFSRMTSNKVGHPDWNDQVSWMDVEYPALEKAIQLAQFLSDADMANIQAHGRHAWEHNTELFTKRIHANIAALGESA